MYMEYSRCRWGHTCRSQEAPAGTAVHHGGCAPTLALALLLAGQVGHHGLSGCLPQALAAMGAVHACSRLSAWCCDRRTWQGTSDQRASQNTTHVACPMVVGRVCQCQTTLRPRLQLQNPTLRAACTASRWAARLAALSTATVPQLLLLPSPVSSHTLHSMALQPHPHVLPMLGRIRCWQHTKEGLN